MSLFTSFAGVPGRHAQRTGRPVRSPSGFTVQTEGVPKLLSKADQPGGRRFLDAGEGRHLAAVASVAPLMGFVAKAIGRSLPETTSGLAEAVRHHAVVGDTFLFPSRGNMKGSFREGGPPPEARRPLRRGGPLGVGSVHAAALVHVARFGALDAARFPAASTACGHAAGGWAGAGAAGDAVASVRRAWLRECLPGRGGGCGAALSLGG